MFDRFSVDPGLFLFFYLLLFNLIFDLDLNKHMSAEIKFPEYTNDLKIYCSVESPGLQKTASDGCRWYS